MASVVDTILNRWKKDILKLEKAATTERKAADNCNARANDLLADMHVHINEAERADKVITNLRELLAMPESDKA